MFTSSASSRTKFMYSSKPCLEMNKITLSLIIISDDQYLNKGILSTTTTTIHPHLPYPLPEPKRFTKYFEAKKI